MFTAEVIQSGIKVLGINFDPALFAFLVAFIIFGGLNLIEFKKFW